MTTCSVSFSLSDKDGNTALHHACRGKHLEIAKLLLEHMSREAALALNKVDRQLLIPFLLSLSNDDTVRVD